MDTTSTPSVIERFCGFLKFLVERVSKMPTPGSPPPWEFKAPLASPVMMAVLFRLGRLRRHFRRFAAQAVAPQPQPQTPAVGATPPAQRCVSPSRTAGGRRMQKAARARALALSGVEQVVLPTKLAWLATMIADAPMFRARLTDLLRDPELAAMVAAEPRLGRVLRSLVHMMGLRRRPDLIALHALAKRVRAPRPRPPSQRRLRPAMQPPEPKRSGVVIIDYWDVVAGLRAQPG